MTSEPKTKGRGQDTALTAVAAALLSAPGPTSAPDPYVVTAKFGSGIVERSVAAEAAQMDRKQVDDIVALSEAKTDVKLERLLGEMRSEFARLRGDMSASGAKLSGEISSVSAKLSSLPTTFQMVSWMIGVGIAITGLALAVFRLSA